MLKYIIFIKNMINSVYLQHLVSTVDQAVSYTALFRIYTVSTIFIACFGIQFHSCLVCVKLCVCVKICVCVLCMLRYVCVFEVMGCKVCVWCVWRRVVCVWSYVCVSSCVKFVCVCEVVCVCYVCYVKFVCVKLLSVKWSLCAVCVEKGGRKRRRRRSPGYRIKNKNTIQRCGEKRRVWCICYLSKTHSVRNFLQNSISNSSTSTTHKHHL